MKNILLLLLILISFSAFSQNPDYHRYGARTKFVQPDTLSTTQRNALSPKLGTLIYHKDTGISQWEKYNGTSWDAFGDGGSVDSVNGQIGVVTIDADAIDDSATTNKFVTEEEKELIGTNIYTTDGTLTGNRSINIGEYSLAVKGSLGMPLLMVNDTVVHAFVADGTKIRGFTTSIIQGEEKYIGIANTDPYTNKEANITLHNTDSTSIRLRSEKFIFNIEGTTPNTGDVLTLQSDGTTKFQAPSGGGGGSDDQTASEVPFTPYSTIAATNVQDAIEEVLDEIPTSLAAANITVSPSIGGNTDAYAVMDDHEDRIEDLENAPQIEVIQIAAGNLTSDITTGTAKAYFRMPYAATLTDVRVSLLVAGTTTGITVDINENGTSVLSTKLTTDATEKTSTTATTPAVISDSSLADDSEITIDFDAVPTGGKAPIVTLYLIRL